MKAEKGRRKQRNRYKSGRKSVGTEKPAKGAGCREIKANDMK
jgi:hypothetical protein